jgi:anaerobic selenocysteine-containing dehydrogenase
MREPEALLHPEVAKATGARHGQPVDIFSPYGRIRLRAVVTEDVHPECVVVPAGWAEANPNLLISDARRDPISGFPAFRSGVCRIEPLQGS